MTSTPPPEPPVPAAGDPLPGALRIGDAERESAATALGTHFAAGRIDQDELDERLGAVYAARTVAELARPFADLPQPHPRLPEPARPAPEAAADPGWRWSATGRRHPGGWGGAPAGRGPVWLPARPFAASALVVALVVLAAVSLLIYLVPVGGAALFLFWIFGAAPRRYHRGGCGRRH